MKQVELKFPFDRIRGKFGDLVYCAGEKRTYVRKYVKRSQDNLSRWEIRARERFSQAASFWRELSYIYKNLYNCYALATTNGHRTGYNLFIKDYINLRRIYDREETERIVLKSLENWHYKSLNYNGTNAFKEASYQLAIEDVRSNNNGGNKK